MSKEKLYKKYRDEAKFYYYRGEKNKPIVTVCLIKLADGKVCRGIAICSDTDNPVYKEGRRKAFQRAYDATKDFSRVPFGHDAIASPRAIRIKERVGMPFNHKAYHNIRPTEFEEKILHFQEKRK